MGGLVGNMTNVSWKTDCWPVVAIMEHKVPSGKLSLALKKSALC
jgi:hypothetical protein